MNLAEKINRFNLRLRFEGTLPPGIRIMNPFSENQGVVKGSAEFYRIFYSDDHPRRLILGINPGRFGAGITGIPFTDTYRLKEKCHLEIPGVTSYETSSVFIYEMIDAYGGPELFYHHYYISAVCPLGFVKITPKGKEVNYNYYDDKTLQEAMEPFIIASLEEQIAFGLRTDTCFCLGNNKNFHFLENLNRKKGYFGEIIPLEHPRFIMQYRSKKKDEFLRKYVTTLKSSHFQITKSPNLVSLRE